ncbi:helicase-exonuclease AddAB subunit AddA [Atopobacter sp. AH10]|uniref:helicase-exonuclease AddAB subunit AddA n=1 Tax=Atopobacter sp. AH10 TaxID=2315861 RepID=UPI000EF28A2B|nr:helicase-exonuclease AddAB subunit AddA [Atopobacter sp. AH10]RLK63190.1 helicase-exonuclease AddAB subunit AddA [Atopobacter sp. AH10]
MTNSSIPPKPESSKFTNSQWQAIYQSGSDLLVSASAGSGKTTVLVQRVMEKILSGISIDRLLIVTFTEKAAKEMKERIEKGLQEALNTARGQEAHYLKGQLLALPDAYISTLHAFCKRLIDQYYFLLDIDPQFSLVTKDSQLNLFKEDAWTTLQEEGYQSDMAFIQLAQEYGSHKGDNDFRSMIECLDTFSRVTPDPDAFYDHALEAYQGIEDCQIFGESILYQKYLLAYLEDDLLGIFQEAEQLNQLSQGISGSLKKWMLHPPALRQLIKDVIHALKLNNFDLAYQLIQKIGQENLKTPVLSKKMKESEDAPTLENMQKLSKSILQSLKRLKEQVFFEDGAGHLEILRLTKIKAEKMISLAKRYRQILKEKKRQQHAIDFSDLEHFALELLSIDMVRDLLKEQYNEVMVDEYQDINPLQEAIIQAVSHHNRFMVGDVKQSIYGFRLANPYLFLNKYERYQRDEKEGKLIILAENFRSSPEVIGSVNQVFRAIMDKKVGDMAYDKKAELIAGLQADKNDDLETELILVDKPSETLEEDMMEDFDWTNSSDFHLLCSRISDLVASKKASYKEIAILLPNRNRLEDLENIASKWQIPLISDKAEDYFKRTEVAIVLSLLQVIDNPYQDIPLVSLMRSPIYGLKEKALSHIRSRSNAKAFYQAVCDFAHEDLSKEDPQVQQYQQQVLLLLSDLTKWRNLSHQESLVGLLSRVYRDTLFKERVALMPNADKRVQNLEALLVYASDFEKLGSLGLSRFITHLNEMISYDEDLSSSSKEISESIDAVRVMTIHGSKGLEFPYVFLMGLDNRFRFYTPKTPSTSKKNRLFLSFEDGIALDLIDEEKKIIYPSLLKTILQLRQDKKILAEEMRKLYVAMTRAKKKLVMIGQTDPKKRVEYAERRLENDQLSAYHRLHATSFLDWLAPVAYHTNFSLEIVDDISSSISQWLQQIAGRKEDLLAESKKEDSSEKDHSSQSLLQMDWASLLEQVYPHQVAAQTTAYQAVSEIKQIVVDPDELELEPIESIACSLSNRFRQPMESSPAFASESQLTPTARGSLIHELFKRWALRCLPHPPQDKEKEFKLIYQELALGKKGLSSDEQVRLLNFFDRHIQGFLKDPLDHLHVEEAFTLVLPANRLFNESDLEENDQLLIHGIIDLFIEKEDGLILLDYKTDHLKGKTLEEYAKRYIPQLSAYAIALEAAYKKPVIACYLAFTEADQLLPIAVPHLFKGSY